MLNIILQVNAAQAINTETTEVIIMIIIMLLAGVVGGIANYYMNNLTKTWDRFDFTKSIIMGIVASATVPLFLKTLGSDLLNQIDFTDYLAIVGFCLLASVYSSRFLQSLMDKVTAKLNKVTEEQKLLKGKVDIVVAQKSSDKKLLNFETPVIKNVPQADADAVVRTLSNTRAVFWTLDDIAVDTGLANKDIKNILDQLIAHNMVHQTTRSDNKAIWSLSAKAFL